MASSDRILDSFSSISYDRSADVLYITCGKKHPGITREISPYVLLRLDPFTDELVGITVVDFKDWLEEFDLSSIPGFTDRVNARYNALVKAGLIFPKL